MFMFLVRKLSLSMFQICLYQSHSFDIAIRDTIVIAITNDIDLDIGNEITIDIGIDKIGCQKKFEIWNPWGK